MSLSVRSYGSRTMSVYGGAGGRGTRISSSTVGSMLGKGFNLADGLDLHVSANEKATMQNLNDRLSSYLEKVRSLEDENASLEKKIREWYESRTFVSHDHTAFLTTIESLRDEIRSASRCNARKLLDIDNAKLAADDFRVKSDNELALRMAVEADIASLRRVLDDMSLSRSDLEMRYEGQKDELIMLRRNHEEDMAQVRAQVGGTCLSIIDMRGAVSVLQDMAQVRAQVGGQVNVAVDAAPSVDLGQAMTELREHYGAVTAKNQRDLEAWYQSKIATVEQECLTQNEGLVVITAELKELKSTYQRLEIELQAHHAMKASLEGTLEETLGRYAAQLAVLQSTVTGLEEQLSQLHANIASHQVQYDQLLDLKTRLELEIAEYRRLLDGEEHEAQVVRKVITVVETIVDGKVVESSQTVVQNEE